MNEDRAIVSEIAGTTRDTIEEVLNIGGILFRLIDTAGIRKHSTDTIERIGVGRSLEKMEQADIVVYLFDVNDEVGEVMERRRELGDAGFAAGWGAAAAGAGGMGAANGANGGGPAGAANGAAGAGAAAVANGAQRFVWVGNKADLLDGDAARRKFSGIPDAIFVSAKERRDIEVLRQRLIDRVLQGNATDGTIVTNARHYRALQQVAESLTVIHTGLDELLSGDLLALDIRHCLHYLGEITGEITTEDRLDYIFSKFCIGK